MFQDFQERPAAYNMKNLSQCIHLPKLFKILIADCYNAWKNMKNRPWRIPCQSWRLRQGCELRIQSLPLWTDLHCHPAENNIYGHPWLIIIWDDKLQTNPNGNSPHMHPCHSPLLCLTDMLEIILWIWWWQWWLDGNLTPRIPNSCTSSARHKNRHLAISREPRVVKYIRWCQNDRKNLNNKKTLNKKI